MLLFLTSSAHEQVSNWMAAECHRRSEPFLCLYTEQFPQDIILTLQPTNGFLQGAIEHSSHKLDLDQVCGVWCYLSETMTPDPSLDAVSAQIIRQESREALYGFYRAFSDRRWINSPHTENAARYRAYQLRLATHVGFQIPPTIITNHPNDAVDFFDRYSGNVVYKPIRSLMLFDNDHNPTHTTYVTPVTRANMLEYAESIRNSPCIFQVLIPKRYDVTVYVIGKYAWATAIHSQDDTLTNTVDYRRDGLWNYRHTPMLLPPPIERMCLDMSARMGLRMCNFDLALTYEDTYVFLDANPTDLWAGIEALVGFPLCAAIIDDLLGVDTLADHPYLKDRSLNFHPSSNVR